MRVERRDFLKALALSAIGLGIAPDVMAQNILNTPSSRPEKFDDHLKDYLHKMKNFNSPHKDDIYVNSAEYQTFESVVMRLRRLEQVAGHGNFQLLSFDEGIKVARISPEIGEFSRAELNFLEAIFFAEAARYGFFGQKPLNKLTDRIKEKDVEKVPYTGNYMFEGISLEIYKKIKQQLGDQVILTSGIRGVMKQFLLFLDRAYKSNGNLSLASRSLAPPGYSYHGVGDFDVGQAGLGADNFTERFTTTEVFKRLSELGYLTLRYPEQNLLGVRFEPWHIKIETVERNIS